MLTFGVEISKFRLLDGSEVLAGFKKNIREVPELQKICKNFSMTEIAMSTGRLRGKYATTVIWIGCSFLKE